MIGTASYGARVGAFWTVPELRPYSPFASHRQGFSLSMTKARDDMGVSLDYFGVMFPTHTACTSGNINPTAPEAPLRDDGGAGRTGRGRGCRTAGPYQLVRRQDGGAVPAGDVEAPRRPPDRSSGFHTGGESSRESALRGAIMSETVRAGRRSAR